MCWPAHRAGRGAGRRHRRRDRLPVQQGAVSAAPLDLHFSSPLRIDGEPGQSVFADGPAAQSRPDPAGERGSPVDGIGGAARRPVDGWNDHRAPEGARGPLVGHVVVCDHGRVWSCWLCACRASPGRSSAGPLSRHLTYRTPPRPSGWCWAGFSGARRGPGCRFRCARHVASVGALPCGS